MNLHFTLKLADGQLDAYTTTSEGETLEEFQESVRIDSIYFQKPLPGYDEETGAPVIVVNVTDLQGAFMGDPMFDELSNKLIEGIITEFENRLAALQAEPAA